MMFESRHRIGWLTATATVVVGTAAESVYAGMPSARVVLREVTTVRLDVISFFGLAFFVSAWFVQRIWNALRNDFTRLPRLNYGRAVMLTLCWSFLFMLVLTMISGARELMSPGAWRLTGATYELVEPEPGSK